MKYSTSIAVACIAGASLVSAAPLPIEPSFSVAQTPPIVTPGTQSLTAPSPSPSPSPTPSATHAEGDAVKNMSYLRIAITLKVPEGRVFLKTDKGKQWLAQFGIKWMQTTEGKQWLTTTGGKNWLETATGKEWLKTEIGKKWLKTPNGIAWKKAHKEDSQTCPLCHHRIKAPSSSTKKLAADLTPTAFGAPATG